jgi:S-adenosylmethionine/arginine decarboxylase-like enzyme
MTETNRSLCGLQAHRHLLITGHTTSEILKTLSRETLRQHLLDMVSKIGMTVALPPRVGYSNRPENTGFIGIVGITTSHIAFHHWDCVDPGVLQYDVFSCKDFDPDVVMNSVRAFWRCSIVSSVLISRYPTFSIQDLLAPMNRLAKRNESA